MGTSIGIDPRPTPGPGGPGGAIPAFPPSAGSSIFSFTFHYTVNGDGSWTATPDPGSFNETFVHGPRSNTDNPTKNPTNQTATIANFPAVSGLISGDGKTLIAVTDPIDATTGFAPTIETVTFSNGDVWPQICHRSRVYIALPNGK